MRRAIPTESPRSRVASGPNGRVPSGRSSRAAGCDIKNDMTDPRVAKLADLLVNYSLELKPGEIVRLDGGTVAAPFVRELYRAALKAGANPRTRIEVEGIDVIAVGEASDEQLTFISEIDRFEIEKVDAIVTIWGDRNTRALSQADPKRVSKKIASRRTLTEGEIRFSFPAIFQGRGVEDVRLRFEGGRVVHAEAGNGNAFLQSLLEMDAGARILGEASFGLNYEIDRFTRDILFDEKIGGTMHFALGSSFKKLGGQKESGLHCDLSCALHADGEGYADGELMWKAGHFLREPGVVAPESVTAS